MSDTYGRITRDGNWKTPDYPGDGGVLTPKMLEDALAAMKASDEAYDKWQQEFYKALHPYSELAKSDAQCYFAIFRLLLSSRAPLHPKEYESLMAVVKSRGIDLFGGPKPSASEPPAHETSSPS